MRRGRLEAGVELLGEVEVVVLCDGGFVVAARHEEPSVGERRVPLGGDIDEPVEVLSVLVLLAERRAVGSLVVPPLHAVEEVADVEDVRAALLGLEEVLHLEVSVARYCVVMRVRSEQEELLIPPSLHRQVGGDNGRGRTRGACDHAVTLSEMMIST